MAVGGPRRRTYRKTGIVTYHPAPAPSPFPVGIRLMRSGWLYSIGGPDFTEVLFADSSRLLIVTEDAERLQDFLNRALP